MIATLKGYTKAEAAKELGISASRVDALMREGRIPYLICGNLGRLIDENAVAAMKRQRERQKEEALRHAHKS